MENIKVYDHVNNEFDTRISRVVNAVSIHHHSDVRVCCVGFMMNAGIYISLTNQTSFMCMTIPWMDKFR